MKYKIKTILTRFLFIFTGAASLLWFLIRVIPKPSRAAYPCQRAAFPVASAFVLWLTGITGSAAFILALRKFCKKHRRALIISMVIAAVSIGCVTVANNELDQPVEETREEAFGVPQGVNPGRVTWAFDEELVTWTDEMSGYWAPEAVNQERMNEMLEESILALAGESTIESSWNTLFSHTNEQLNRGSRGYTSGEVIAVKVNLNNQDNPYAQENIAIDASPHVILALLDQLIETLGVQEHDIIIYDALRPISDPILNYCKDIYPSVQFIGGLGYPNNMDTDFEWTDNVIQYSDGFFDRSNARKIPQFLMDCDYIINMAILKTHGSVTGVTLCGKNHYGSVGNPADLHSMTHPSSTQLYSPQVDIAGHEIIYNKTVLYMIDGLFGALGYSGCVSAPSNWDSAPFNGGWPSSLFLSQDMVAIDSVGLDFLAAEGSLRSQSDNYLHEAALANEPPSGTLYDPEGDGIPMESLGVHEHWNNSEDKSYEVIDFISISL